MNKPASFEIKRRLFHLISPLLLILIYILTNKYFNQKTALLFLTFILVFFLMIEFVRIKLKKKIPFFHIFYRNKEKNKIASYIYILIGAIIAFSVFDFKIALAAFLMMVFGDVAAALIGIKFGKHWLKEIPNTAWEGIIAEFIINLIIGFILLPHWTIVLVMALTATFVETVFVHADDNMIIPIFSGFNGQIALIILKIIGLI